MIFPATVAAGSRTFPKRHRGLATTLILATWDAGLLIGSPVAGVVLHYSESLGLPPYPAMFACIATLMAILTGWYGWTAWNRAPQNSPARAGGRAVPMPVHLRPLTQHAAEPVETALSRR